MKTWKIPVTWMEMGTVRVVADTLAEAIEIAKDKDGVIPLPDNGEFLDGSWEVDCDDIEAVRSCYNDNQEDEVVEYKKVIHAYWKPMKAYPDERVCSHCGVLWQDEETPYCHDCGATMDLESEDRDE